MEKHHYTKGLHDLGNNTYAYLQPNGGWGWSNAGLVTDGEASLLIDTLYDLKLTQTMLDEMRKVSKAANKIDTLINTHADGDHCYGNQLITDATIIASQNTIDQMRSEPPPSQMAKVASSIPPGPGGAFMRETLGPFDFTNITLTFPTKSFVHSMNLSVGNKLIHILQVGPAHTKGDTLVYIPDDKTIFTGDILFIGSHPIIWAGPVRNWLKACDIILELDVQTIVPGHGPVTDKSGVKNVKAYLDYIYQETVKRFQAGMSVIDAAYDIPLDRYSSWINSERIIANVDAIYHELNGQAQPTNVHALFAQMAQWSH